MSTILGSVANQLLKVCVSVHGRSIVVSSNNEKESKA